MGGIEPASATVCQAIDYLAPPVEPAALYAELYAGRVARYAQHAKMRAIVAYTRQFVRKHLAPYPPVEIHRYLAPEQLETRLQAVRRDYSRSRDVKQLWHALFESVGLDPRGTARDRLMLRFHVPSAAHSSLTTLRCAVPVEFHRDSWGTQLAAQINWWAPVWPICASRTFALYPQLWAVPIANTSAKFDLGEVMERLRRAPKTLGPADLAPRPLCAMDPTDGVPVVLEPGEIIAFSGALPHAGLPNYTGLTRVSLETRTVSIQDVIVRRGAPNVDGQARWVAPGLFSRLSDGVALNSILGCERLVPFRRW